MSRWKWIARQGLSEFPENFWNAGEECSGGHLILGYKVEDVAIRASCRVPGHAEAHPCENIRVSRCDFLECATPVACNVRSDDWRVRDVVFEDCRMSMTILHLNMILGMSMREFRAKAQFPLPPNHERVEWPHVP